MILLAAQLALLAAIAYAIDRLVEVAGESRATKMTRRLLWAFAALVLVESALGALGLLTRAATLGTLAAGAASAQALTRRRPPVERRPAEPLSPLAAGLLAALIAVFALRLWAGLHRTTFLYDTLSYHLHVPATWMHQANIGIVPAVFGDPSPAYAPANLELWFLFLMAPLRSDYLAAVGQLPVAALAAAAIVATIRDGGGSRAAALAGALVFLLVPEVWTQAPTAMTDLGIAAFLLAALPFALRLWTAAQPRRADLVTAAGAIGLAIGSKYAAATLALPFLALAAAAWLRRRPIDARGAVLALLVMTATGGFWYVRNTALTGNPFYPVAVPGLGLPALYGGAQMRAWDYHVPVSDLRALGALLLGAGVAFSVATAVTVATVWNHARPARTIVAGLLVASLAIFWFAVPYQESRFLFTPFALAAALLAQRAGDGRAGPWLLAAAIAGALLEGPALERLLPVAIGAAFGIVVSRWPTAFTRIGRRAAVAGASAVAAALLIALAVGARAHARRDPGYDVGDDDLAAAWSWVRANVRDARVAYTGTNLAFPLAGAGLANHVAYVNVAGRPGDLLHDFGPPADGTAEPAPYRRGGNPGAWLANLRADHTDVLFVASLYPIVRRTIGADRDGFPIERAWADARADVFRLRYASAAARVYTVAPP